MRAWRLKKDLGAALVGRTVMTRASGNYPGGAAVVVSVAWDALWPETAFWVDHPTAGRVNILELEMVALMDGSPEGFNRKERIEQAVLGSILEEARI